MLSIAARVLAAFRGGTIAWRRTLRKLRLHLRQQCDVVLDPNQFPAEKVVPFLEPDLKKSHHVLRDAHESHKDWVEEVAPKHNLELVVEHHDPNEGANQDEHLVVDVGVLIDVGAHQLSGFVAALATQLRTMVT